jgi:hypothetical protein
MTTIIEIIYTVAVFSALYTHKLNSRQLALTGLLLLALVAFLTIITLDVIAGKIAELVWITFALAAVAQWRYSQKES